MKGRTNRKQLKKIWVMFEDNEEGVIWLAFFFMMCLTILFIDYLAK